jgi:hypothetical protein
MEMSIIKKVVDRIRCRHEHLENGELINLGKNKTFTCRDCGATVII